MTFPNLIYFLFNSIYWFKYTIKYPDTLLSTSNELGDKSQSITENPFGFEMKEVYKTDNPISAKTVQQVTKADDTHVSYIGLYPNTIYNLYVCKQAPVSIPFTEVFTEHNLLYINQYESDADGNLSIDYVPMQEATGAVEILVAQKRINITDDARVCMADIKYDGETHSPLIEYYFSDSLLSEGIDYEIQGDYEAKEPGTYTIRIRGIGQYTGTLELQYKIIDTTPVVTKPTPVKNLKAVSVAKTKVKLTWTATEKDVKYLIYAKKKGKYGYCGMTSSTSYTDTKALSDEFGFYWVYPYKTDETGKNIVGSCTKYVYARGVCVAVTDLKASSVKGGVKLSWTKSAGAEGYLIYGMEAKGKYGYIGMTKTNTYTHKKASKDVYNFYWVFPYHRDAKGKIVVGKISSHYVYGKAK